MARPVARIPGRRHDTPVFADQERAALSLAALLVDIALINVWKRLNASVKQVDAPWK